MLDSINHVNYFKQKVPKEAVLGELEVKDEPNVKVEETKVEKVVKEPEVDKVEEVEEKKPLRFLRRKKRARKLKTKKY